MPDTCVAITPYHGAMATDDAPPLLGDRGPGDVRHSRATLALLDQLRQHHPPSAAHSVRVARTVMAMWSRAPETLGDPTLVATAGALHDLGKLFVSAATLDSGRQLSPEELAEVREHPATGARVLASLGFADEVVAAARDHHERWTGQGYPTGRPSRLLHPLARVVAVADAFVAMVEPGRAYRTSLGKPAALTEIARCSGTHFDPDAAALLIATFAGDAAARFEIATT